MKNNNSSSPRKRNLRWLKWPIILLVIAGIGFAAWKLWPREPEVVVSNYAESYVTRGDLDNSVQGSGNVQPSVNRTVTVSDDVTITKLLVGVGDSIEEGGALAEVDKETLRDTIESQKDQIEQKELGVQKARTSFESYKITAPRDGRIRELSAKIGENAADTGKAYGGLCVISTGGKMTATLEVIEEVDYSYGPSSESSSDSSTETASKTSTSDTQNYGWFYYFDRTITLVKGDVINVSVDGVSMSASVTALSKTSITVEIPGDTYAIGARVYFMDPWGIERIAEGKLALSESVAITGTGKISDIHVLDGQMVSRGDLLFSLDETDAQLSLQEQRLTLNQLKESLAENETKLEENHLTSPISGTIIELMVEDGNTVKSGNEFVRIMDATTMDLTISVDELDIPDVKTGMAAKISVDAYEGEEFEGVVKEIGIMGTTSNSVTTYSVVITMQGDERIKPGMSATADIVIEKSTDTLMVPVEALVKRNNSYFARVPADSEAAAAQRQAMQQRMERPEGEGSAPLPSGDSTATARASGGEGTGAEQSGSGGTQGGSGSAERRQSRSNTAELSADAEFALVPVTIGLVGDTYAEVIEGLSEGDVVLVPTTSSSASNSMGMPGGSNNVMIIGGMGGAAPAQPGGSGGSFRQQLR